LRHMSAGPAMRNRSENGQACRGLGSGDGLLSRWRRRVPYSSGEGSVTGVLGSGVGNDVVQRSGDRQIQRPDPGCRTFQWLWVFGSVFGSLSAATSSGSAGGGVVEDAKGGFGSLSIGSSGSAAGRRLDAVRSGIPTAVAAPMLVGPRCRSLWIGEHRPSPDRLAAAESLRSG
jgi:hypothetical protein